MFQNITGLDDITVYAAVLAAIEAYGEDDNQQYVITSVKFKDKVISPWRLIGMYEQVSRLD